MAFSGQDPTLRYILIINKINVKTWKVILKALYIYSTYDEDSTNHSF